MTETLENNLERTEDYLTTGEVAKICGVHFRTVIRWIQRRQLKAFQLPGRGDNRIARGDLLAFLKTNKMDAALLGHLEPKRILIVDDEPNVAMAIARTLKLAGFTTQVASDGFQAGAQLQEFRPALMTLDIKMPGLTGHEVIHFVRSQVRFDGLKILVISAMPRSELEQALQAGADAFLEKPFSNADLRERVQQLLQGDANLQLGAV